MRNEVVLEGLVESHESLRYTPAGVANFVGVLTHQLGVKSSETQEQALTITLTAFAEVAISLSQLNYPLELIIKGQLVKKHANSKELVIKVNQYKLSHGV
ncbi:MAG: hypothetical protein KGQ44_02235 [Betaproteobacteria bacterium]|nr:hypothetical protein [Betaproteobacteria bacterium]